MSEKTYASDNELKMQELSINLHTLRNSLQQARLNKTIAQIQIIDFDSLVSATIQEINVVQKTGVKLVTSDRVKELMAQRQPQQMMR